MSNPKPVPAEEPKKRRRLTPEQRIAEREAEIAAIKEAQRERVHKLIDEARAMLDRVRDSAKQSGMGKEAALCQSALTALDDSPEIDR